jgi:poly(3-hydroxybutyrate) depolymerase
MILSFHGNGKDMTSHATLSRFIEPAINPNAVAVFPNGLFGATSETKDERCWQGAPYCKHNDTLFVTELLEFMADNYCVDASRIYATGKSIGGGFADVLACTDIPGGEIAAFGVCVRDFSTSKLTFF